MTEKLVKWLDEQQAGQVRICVKQGRYIVELTGDYGTCSFIDYDLEQAIQRAINQMSTRGKARAPSANPGDIVGVYIPDTLRTV